MRDFVATVQRHLGALDVFVNNAGILSAGPAVDQPDTVTRRVIDVNLIGTINGTKAALTVMLPRNRGHIVNVASISGESYGAGEASYCASKYGVVGYTVAVRFELHGSGIKLTLVMPTMVRTRLTSGVSELRGPPLPHKIEAADVAQTIAAVIRRPRRRAYVPSGARVLMALNRATPAPIREANAATLGARSIFSMSTVRNDLNTKRNWQRVPPVGLEPTRLSATVFETALSTYSNTGA